MSDRPPLYPENIPAELKARRQWVLWKWEERGGKLTKPPYQANGRHASVTNPKEWTTYDTAIIALNNGGDFAGIGYVLTGDYVAWDLDKSLDERGIPEPWALEIIAAHDSYTEITPSKRGLRALVRGKLPPGKNRKGPVEVYTNGRYVTVTGNIFGEPKPIAQRDEAIEAMWRKYIADSAFKKANLSVETPLGSSKEPKTELGRLLSGDWQGRFPSQSEAEMRAAAIAARLTPDPAAIDALIRGSRLFRPKWDEKHGELTYGERTIAKALESGPEHTELTVIRISDVVEKKVEWLWPGRLPLGMLVTLDGDPDRGKSTLTLDIAARLSRGAEFPDGWRPEPEAVLIMSHEDDPERTIKPRLRVAGADQDKILYTEAIWTKQGEEMVSLLDHIPLIEEKIVEHEVRLLIIDPLFAYTPISLDSHRDQHMRRMLMPLAMMAKRTQCAVILVRHLKKTPGGTPLYRGMGTIGITGAARMSLLVAIDPDQLERRLLAPYKSNLCKRSPTLAFRLESAPKDPDVAVVVWEGNSDWVSEAIMERETEKVSKRDQVKNFLYEFLSEGPRPADEVFAEGARRHFTEITIKRASREMGGIKKEKTGFGKGWKWSLEM